MKSELINYKAKFAPEMSEPKEGEEAVEISPAFEYSGTVAYNMPESLEEAAQMFGEGPALSAMIDAITVRVQALSRRYRSQGEAQEAVATYIPGVSKKGTGPTQAQVKAVLSKMSKEDIEKLLAGLN